MEPILTERLVLERFAEEHRADFLRMSANPDVMRWVGGTLTPDAAEERFARKLTLWAEHDFGWRAAHTREGRDWVGILALQPVPDGFECVGEPEIGWWIEPAMWGRGYATEAALAVRDNAFGDLGLTWLRVRVHRENGASAYVATKLGARFERSAGDLDLYVLEPAA